MDRIKKGETVAEAFSSNAETYDRWFDEPAGHTLFELEFKAIKVLMKNISPPFLEIGVGSGRFAMALGIKYGVEPAEALLEMAVKRGIKAEKAFGEKLPFTSGIFGGVFILFTLCFVEDPGKVLAESRRVLRTGGGLIIGIINRNSQWGATYQAKKAEAHPLYRHAHIYSTDEVVSLLKESGLTVESFSSVLRQPSTDSPHMEDAYSQLIVDAGFVCIRARKTDNRGTHDN